MESSDATSVPCRPCAREALQVSLNTVSLVGGLVALPGLLALWRRTSVTLAKMRPGFLLVMAIGWPALAAAELALRVSGAGSFPGHDLVVGAPFVAALVAALYLAQLRPKASPNGGWSIAAYALAIAYFVLPRALGAIPAADPDRFRIVSAGGLLLLGVVIASGVLVVLLGVTMPTPTRGNDASGP